MAGVSIELLAKARLRLPLHAEELAELVRGAVGEAARGSEETPLESLARVQGVVQQRLDGLESAARAFDEVAAEIPALICAGHLEAAYVAGLAELAALSIRESAELMTGARERTAAEQVRWLLALAQEQWDAWEAEGQPEISGAAWWSYLALVLAQKGRGLLITPEGSRELGEEPPLVTAVRLAEASRAGGVA